jgi:hypothetical protein
MSCWIFVCVCVQRAGAGGAARPTQTSTAERDRPSGGAPGAAAPAAGCGSPLADGVARRVDDVAEARCGEAGGRQKGRGKQGESGRRGRIQMRARAAARAAAVRENGAAAEGWGPHAPASRAVRPAAAPRHRRRGRPPRGRAGAPGADFCGQRVELFLLHQREHLGGRGEGEGGDQEAHGGRPASPRDRAPGAGRREPGAVRTVALTGAASGVNRSTARVSSPWGRARGEGRWVGVRR